MNVFSYMAYEAIFKLNVEAVVELVENGNISNEDLINNYRKAVAKG